MKKILILSVLLVVVAMPEFCMAGTAAKPVTQRLCMNNATGAIVTKVKCAKGETILSGQVIQAMAGVGPQGAPGVNGTFDPSKCSYRQGVNYGVGVIFAKASCNAGEFVQTHGVQVDYSAVDVIQIGLLFPPGVGVATGVEYEVGVNVPGDYTGVTVQVDLVCCRG